MRTRIGTLSAGAIAVALLVALASAPSAFSAPTIARLDNGGDCMVPAVSGDRAVWAAYTGPSAVGWYTWTPAGGAVQFSSGTRMEYPVVSGDRVVWADNSGLVDGVLMTWTPSGGLQTADGTVGYHAQPRISGDRVVWWGGSLPYGIFTWTPGGVVQAVSDNALGTAKFPRVSGDRIVWQQGDYNPPSSEGADIFTWTSLGGRQRLTTNGAVNEYADVSGDRVVWRGQRGSDGGADHEIFTWTPSGGIQQVTQNATSDGSPKVSGDRIVWAGVGGSDGGTDTEIFTWTPAGGVQQLTANAYSEESPEIDGNRIVWVADVPMVTLAVDGGHEVFTWTPAGGVQRVTDNAVADRWPSVSGNRVVWQEATGLTLGHDQIWMATFPAEPTQLTSTSVSKPSVSPSKPKKGKSATFTAALTPGAAMNAVTAKLYAAQKLTKTVTKKVGGKKKRVKVTYWKTRKTVTMAKSPSGSSARLSAKATLGYKGSWKAWVVCTGSSGYGGCTSAAKTFTVK